MKEKMEIDSVPNEELTEYFNFYIRDKVGQEPHDYLKNFLIITRQLAYATCDDSWGELEKHLSIIIRNMIIYERKLAEMLSEQEFEDLM